MNLRKPMMHLFTLAIALTGLASCGLMHDDLDECAVKPEVSTSVDFVYNYNTALADRFGTDVGAVGIYVFDERGRLVCHEERANHTSGNALKSEGFRIDLGLRPGKYSVYAVAHGHNGGYQAALKAPGAKFRIPQLENGDDLSGFFIALDHENGLVKHQNVMLDTLWTTREARELVVPEVKEPVEGETQQEDVAVTATLPLMRVTNYLRLSFFHENFPKNTDFSNYEVWIESRQPRDRMDIFGNYTGATTTLRFEPFKSTVADDDEGHVCNFVEFGLPRFMMHENEADRVKLCFRNKSTGRIIEADLLGDILSAGKAAFAEHNWSDQEYFDREYNYDAQVVLNDRRWGYANVYVRILSWSKRVDNVDL